MQAELSCEIDQSVTNHIHHQIEPPQIATANCWDRTEGLPARFMLTEK
jgi:hypothetical protein